MDGFNQFGFLHPAECLLTPYRLAVTALCFCGANTLKQTMFSEVRMQLRARFSRAYRDVWTEMQADLRHWSLMLQPKLPLPSCPLKLEVYLVPPSLNPKFLVKFPSSSRQVISWCLILLKVYQLLYMPLKDPVFKEHTCAMHTGRTQLCVKTHSKKFFLEGLVWSCVGHCLEVPSSARVLQRELWCWTRHSGSHFRGQVPYAGHPHEAVMTPAVPPQKNLCLGSAVKSVYSWFVVDCRNAYIE